MVTNVNSSNTSQEEAGEGESPQALRWHVGWPCTSLAKARIQGSACRWGALFQLLSKVQAGLPFRNVKLTWFYFSFLAEVRKWLIGTPEGVNFGGWFLPHRIPELRSRSSRVGALNLAPEEAEGWRKGMKALPKWLSRRVQPSGSTAVIRAMLERCHSSPR